LSNFLTPKIMAKGETGEITIGEIYQDRNGIGDGVSLADVFVKIGTVQRTPDSEWRRREITEEELFNNNRKQIDRLLPDLVVTVSNK
jgi:hypothetical protein